MEWYSTADSAFGEDMDAPKGRRLAVNVFLRDGDTVYRTWHTNGRGTEQLSHTLPLIDLLQRTRRRVQRVGVASRGSDRGCGILQPIAPATICRKVAMFSRLCAGARLSAAVAAQFVTTSWRRPGD